MRDVYGLQKRLSGFRAWVQGLRVMAWGVLVQELNLS